MPAAVLNLPDSEAGADNGAHVDGWGRDDQFVRRVATLGHLRWNITLGGIEYLPARTGALIVVNARKYSLAPIYTALALGEATDRPVRFVGRPDTAPVGSILRRLGGLIEHPDEVRTALRGRQLVVLGTRPTLAPPSRRARSTTASSVPPCRRRCASTRRRRRAHRSADPPASRSGLTSRREGDGAGPLAELELSDEVRMRIQALLQELGGFTSGTPLDWFPLSGMGGH